jgi:hypothetical protein
MSRLILTKAATPSTPSSDTGTFFYDTTEEIFTQVDDTGTVRKMGQNSIYSRTGDTGAINTVETIIAGGLNNAKIYANSLRVGTTIRAVLEGTCTSTVANASTWRFRFGTAGTTSDGVLGSAATSVAAASGNNIPFECTLIFTVRTIGAAGTISGYVKLVNTGVTGISAVNAQVVELTPTAINTTVDNWLSVTYVSAAATTTSTFKMATIEVVKI